jgi:O-antigen ligase
MAYLAPAARLRSARVAIEPSHLLGLLALGAAFFLSVVMWRFGTEYALTFVAGVIVLGIALAQPRFAIYAVTVFALLSDLHLEDPNRPTGAMLFKSLALHGIPFTPAELLLTIALVGVIVRLLFDDEVQLRPGDLIVPILLLIVATSVGIAIGMSRGADMSVLRTETRGLLFLPVVYLLVTHFVTTRAHLTQFFWVFAIAANIMSLENVYRYFTYVRGSYELQLAPSLAFSHESALFSAMAVILLMAHVVWSRNIFAEWRSIALMVLPIVALLVMRRRAGMVALDAGLIMLCVVLLKHNFKLFLMVTPVAVVGVGLLLAMTWNNPGGSGTFARSFQTATGTGTQSDRDESSDDYRELENINIRENIQSSPITGLGFGRQYAFYVQVADLSHWSLWRYVPHNTVLWFWMKAGIFGFVALATLFGAAIARAMQVLRYARSPDVQAMAFSMGAFVAMFVLYSWVDLGLVTPRTVVIFGVTLGIIGALGYISPTQPHDSEAPA